MDPNPKSHPLLSYVLSRLPSIGPRFAAPSPDVDIEQPAHHPPSSSSGPSVDQMFDLDPKLLAAMSSAVNDVAQTRSVLNTLGDRPDHESVDEARAKLAEIDANLAKKLEDIVLADRPSNVDRLEWRSHLAEKERVCREEAEKEKSVYKAIISLEEMHEAYERMLKEAEDKLLKMVEKAQKVNAEKQSKGKGVIEEVNEEVPEEVDQVNEEVVGVLKEGMGTGVIDRVDLSCRRLRMLPEAFGKIQSLVSINLASNQLEELPDSIGGLQNLEELNVSSNLLLSLPDSIGLLNNLKVLNASGNKLTVLPDSICRCRSLVELDVSFNSLAYLPTNIGYEMSNLQKLSIQLNKIRSIPTSVCEMHSLKHLDAHFNELRGLPLAIGKLTNLETLNLASNFADLTELPETFGDLVSLRELDLSNNQIHALPDTFGRLDNLVKLNLEENPIVIPPVEVVKQGVEAVKEFMIKRWLDMLLEEEQRSLNEAKQQGETGWLKGSASWLTRTVSNVSESLSGYLGSPRTPSDPFLDQQL